MIFNILFEFSMKIHIFNYQINLEYMVQMIKSNKLEQIDSNSLIFSTDALLLQ